jgi:hypothetical protein
MACKTCQQNASKVAGTGKKKKSKKAQVSGLDSINYMKIIAGIAGNFIQGYADEYLDKVDQLKQNEDLKDAVKIAAGVWITTMDSGDGSLEGIGMGIASGAGANIVKRYMNQSKQTTTKEDDKVPGIHGDNPMLIGAAYPQHVYGAPEQQPQQAQIEVQYV